MRSIGLPWSEQLVQRTLIGTGSAVLAARLALQYGVACMCNGGTHHAHRAHGSGGVRCCSRCHMQQLRHQLRVQGDVDVLYLLACPIQFWYIPYSCNSYPDSDTMPVLQATSSCAVGAAALPLMRKTPSTGMLALLSMRGWPLLL
jgi:hypothetical protein